MNSLFLKMLQARGSEYLTLSEQIIITGTSLKAARFGDPPEQVLVGVDATFPFPELLGLEDIFQAILSGEIANFSLKAIVRLPRDQPPIYFDIYLFAAVEINDQESRLICLLEDATERRVLEQELVQNSNEMNLLVNKLQQAKNYTEKILASIGDVLIVTDAHGIIKTVNRATINLFGYREDELIDQPILLITRYPHFIGSLVATNCITKTGDALAVSFSRSTLEAVNEISPGIVYIGRNITETKRQQERQELQYAIAQILVVSPSLNQSVPNIIETICQYLDWDLGELWMPKSLDNTQLGFIGGWHNPTLSLTELVENQQQICIGYNKGMAGRVWAKGEPDWIIEIADDLEFVAKDLLIDNDLHSAFSFPIIGNSLANKSLPESDDHAREDDLIGCEQIVLGVMTFFSRKSHQLDLDQLQIMKSIGYQLGQYINRKQTEAALYIQQEKTNKLLLNILPKSIANRLKEDEITIADTFDDVTVLFADLVGFTQLSSQVSATELVEILNQVFSEFDRLTELYKLEKIKTIGDCYMVVGGLPERDINHPSAIANMALHMQEIIIEFNEITKHQLSLRIGINTGSVIAGVIGLKKFIYDLWGDTVNIASRMESQGLPNLIQVTPTSYDRLKEDYRFSERGPIMVKGKGEMKTYILEGRKYGQLFDT